MYKSPRRITSVHFQPDKRDWESHYCSTRYIWLERWTVSTYVTMLIWIQTSVTIFFSFFCLYLFLLVWSFSCSSSFYYIFATINFSPPPYLSIYLLSLFSLSLSLLLSVRKIADMYSAQGYYTIIPKQLDPNMEGGDDFDGENQ